MLRAATALAESDPELRAALPPGPGLGGTAATRDRLRAAAAELTALADDRADEVLREVRIGRDALTRPAPLSPLAHAAGVRALDDATLLTVRPHLGVQLRPSGTGVELVSPIHTPTRLTAEQAAALGPLLAGSVASVKDLGGPDLLAVLSELLRAGVLVVSETP